MMNQRHVRMLTALALVGMISSAALADRVDTVLKDLTSLDTTQQLQALVNLRSLDDPRIPPALTAKAAQRDAPVSVRVGCINQLGERKVKETLELLRAISVSETEAFAVRHSAMMAILHMTGIESADLFVKLIREDKNVRIKQRAAVCLGLSRNPKVIPKILPLLEDDKTARYAVTALGTVGDVSAVPQLVKRLKTEDFELRIAVIGTLGNLRDKRATDALLNLLKEKNDYQRVVILAALARIADPKIIAPLSVIAKDGTAQESLRTRALLSLAQMKATEALPAVTTLAKDPKQPITIRLTAIQTLGHLGDEAIPTLLELLGNKALANRAALALNKITGAYLGTDQKRWQEFCKGYIERKRRRPR